MNYKSQPEAGFSQIFLTGLVVIISVLVGGGWIYTKQKPTITTVVKENQEAPLLFREQMESTSTQSVISFATSTEEKVVVPDATTDEVAQKQVVLDPPSVNIKKEVLILPTPAVSSQEESIPIVLLPPAPAVSPTSLSPDSLIEKIKPSVVSVQSRAGAGSGFIVSNNYVLTNAHVLTGVYKADVQFHDGTVQATYVVSRDEDEDLALLSIIPSASVRLVVFGSSAEGDLKQGTSVYAFGFPFGLKGDVSFKEGTLSRRLKLFEKDYLEISNTILPGNSGGPLVNGRGEVIGVNTMIVGQKEENQGVQGESIKLSIPSHRAKLVIDRLTSMAYTRTSINKSQVDSYEKLMKEIDESVYYYNEVMKEYNKFIDDKTMSTDYLKLYDSEMGTINGKILTAMKDPPVVSFSTSIIDTTHAFQLLIEETRSMFLNEAKQYVYIRGTDPARTADRKADLERKLGEVEKKISIFNQFYTILVNTSKNQLLY